MFGKCENLNTSLNGKSILKIVDILARETNKKGVQLYICDDDSSRENILYLSKTAL
tara:strand:+ start:1050 stop:1217 length:168 start_codon:yes stop_codon:yes gene_type:complete